MITVDWGNKIVESTASITDVVAFKDQIRSLEESDLGLLYPPIITYKKVDLGGGAFFHAVDFISGYQLKFPNSGNYTIVGNIGATIIPVAGVYVDRKTSAAFATVSGTGGGGGGGTGDCASSAELVTSTNSIIAEINKIKTLIRSV